MDRIPVEISERLHPRAGAVAKDRGGCSYAKIAVFGVFGEIRSAFD